MLNYAASYGKPLNRHRLFNSSELRQKRKYNHKRYKRLIDSIRLQKRQEDSEDLHSTMDKFKDGFSKFD
jgi:hypothetical protein